jgi:hypothetical protein
VNPWARAFHALAFTFVDKSDSGRNRIALANFAGAGASGFVGTLYLPPGYNNLSHAEARTAVSFAGIAAHTPFLFPEGWVKWRCLASRYAAGS